MTAKNKKQAVSIWTMGNYYSCQGKKLHISVLPWTIALLQAKGAIVNIF